MTIRQVLLNGAGTDGDGTTWNDLSDATSAFIGASGFESAVNASAVGDTVFFKDTFSGATAISLTAPTNSIVNYVYILACKSATTNNQGSIVQSDLIPGLRTGNATPAYDDGDIPVLTLTGGTVDFLAQNQANMYGLSVICDDNITLRTSVNNILAEECRFEATGSGDLIALNSSSPGSLLSFKSCKFVLASGAHLYGVNGRVDFDNCAFDVVNGQVFGTNLTVGINANFNGCDLSLGANTNIVRVNTDMGGCLIFRNCKFPASHTLTSGTSNRPFRIEAYGCEDNTGISTSEQALQVATNHGTIDTETTKVRTGGATDNAAGLYSHDFTTFASATTVDFASLVGPWMSIWVEGDGTSKTATVYFTSDDANTEASDWTADEAWLEILYPDDAGESIYDYQTLQNNLLDLSPSDVTDDTGSTWGAGTQNDQKFVATIAPDYEGTVYCRVHFAPGANAETIYVDPKVEIS